MAKGSGKPMQTYDKYRKDLDACLASARSSLQNQPFIQYFTQKEMLDMFKADVRQCVNSKM